MAGRSVVGASCTTSVVRPVCFAPRFALPLCRYFVLVLYFITNMIASSKYRNFVELLLLLVVVTLLFLFTEITPGLEPRTLYTEVSIHNLYTSRSTCTATATINNLCCRAL